MTDPTILLIDDEEDIRRALDQALKLDGFATATFARAERAIERISPGFDGAVVTDIRMPKMDGLALLAAVREIDAEIPVILITGHGDVPLAVEAMRIGAYDFLEKPLAPKRLTEAARRACAVRRLTLENRAMRDQLADRAPLEDPIDDQIIGQSPVMTGLRKTVRAVAASDIDVLILGETGAGKDLAARAIHDASARRDRAFVAVNLAALPAATIESELFGHEAGAFPGAQFPRLGRFEHARGGTLYLDEIAAAPLALQAKLLRVVEERAIERLGSNERIDLDIRFIAASNQDLTALAKANQFRSDLLYRLAVMTLEIPRLSDRPEDIPRLFQHLAHRAAERLNRGAPVIEPALLADLSARDWPGNVRELSNVAERFVLGFDITAAPAAESDAPLTEQVDRFERGVIAAMLARQGGSLKATYESLGLSRKTLYEKMSRHGLKRQDFGDPPSD